MTVSACIIADSIPHKPSEFYGIARLTTFQLYYPRFIHSELMTHRVFSRNASSSRAIPVKRQIEMIEKDMAMPESWGQNQPGMQADNEMSAEDAENAKAIWRNACMTAIDYARRMGELGAHKQIVNRILEPYSHISVVVTATQWENFFQLRAHKDADPTFQALALAMRECMEKSTPTPRKEHLPYLRKHELNDDCRFFMSAARCARVSYNNHDGTKPSKDDDMDLFFRLMDGENKHASPTEHQAIYTGSALNPPSNFHGGWLQFRHALQREKDIC